MIHRRIVTSRIFMLAMGFALVPALMVAQERRTPRPAPGQADPNAESVDLFEAIEAKQVEVKFIPRDAEQARLIVKNKTDKPLSIELPEAFAGVPVLAQAFGGGGAGAGGAQQGVGGGFGGGAGGGQGGAGGGGFFMNVAPERQAEMKVGVVCLEHGKPDPSPAGNYEIRPIESFTADANVHELMKLFGAGKLNHSAAQAAAWHLANNMSWEELANKQIKRLNGQRIPYFNQKDLQTAMAAVNVAKQQAAQNADPSKTDSLSTQTKAAK